MAKWKRGGRNRWRLRGLSVYDYANFGDGAMGQAGSLPNMSAADAGAVLEGIGVVSQENMSSQREPEDEDLVDGIEAQAQ